MPHTEKAALRRKLRALRGEIGQNEREALDAAIVAKIKAHPLFHGARALIAYWPAAGEINLIPLIEAAHGMGIPVYLPRTEDDAMHFYLFEGKDLLTPDRFGIPSPAPKTPLPQDTADMLCLLPGLAADKSGYRLGYGGGFYDRFLCTYAGEMLFPLYHRFLLDAVPHEPHDVKIPLILTEKGAYRYGKMDPAAPTV